MGNFPHKLCRLLQRDSEEPLPFKDGTFDTIITDPPYGLKFMGKKWDYQIPSTACFIELLRVSKPGTTLLCFGGTRTQHRMACNIEDAGWRIWDQILWMYGTGFPKARDISKDIDKAVGAEREVVGVHKGGGMSASIPKGAGTFRDDNWVPAGPDLDITAPATEAAALWDGWKSHGLKPAYEPIICAMKPNEGTYAQNALEWGVSGLAIDRGRIGTKDEQNRARPPRMTNQIYGGGKGTNLTASVHNNTGRFPSNLILGCACASPPPHEPGCACAMLDEQSGESKSTGGSGEASKGYKPDGRTVPGGCQATGGFKDIGGASRFFYCAKASRAERDAGLEDVPTATPGEITGGRKEGSAGLDSPRAGAGRTSGGRNTHPTVKPLALMRYLCRLTATPTGGKILDPFCGSGTTGVAAVLEKRNCVLLDNDPEAIEIAWQRIANA